MAIGTSPRGGAKPDTKVSGFFDLKLITVDTKALRKAQRNSVRVKHVKDQSGGPSPRWLSGQALEEEQNLIRKCQVFLI
jgi:hypothetical protein